MRHKLFSIKRLNVVCFNIEYQNWAITILAPTIHTDKPLGIFIYKIKILKIPYQ